MGAGIQLHQSSAYIQTARGREVSLAVCNYPELFYTRADPKQPISITQGTPVIPQILKKDILLSYPFETIKPFLRMLLEASNDPDVVSIKITLSRVASNSKVVEATINAAENGKNVLVLVQRLARFDQENNIGCSQRPETAGGNVI